VLIGLWHSFEPLVVSKKLSPFIHVTIWGTFENETSLEGDDGCVGRVVAVIEDMMVTIEEENVIGGILRV
jgi:hypothetical protein